MSERQCINLLGFLAGLLFAVLFFAADAHAQATTVVPAASCSGGLAARIDCLNLQEVIVSCAAFILFGLGWIAGDRP